MTTMAAISNNTEEPPAKKRFLGASDRVTIDVGGTKYAAAWSTLTANSAYFSSLLSANWNDGTQDASEIFLDQNPVAFGTLLAYMRRGMIKVEDINTDVLALAEFLGVERLLLAVKVRWYNNIGRGPVLTEDDEIAAAFDQEHGGILNAISAGLFPFFVTPDDVNAEKDLAAVTIYEPADKILFAVNEDLEKVGKTPTNRVRPPSIQCECLVGALNGLFAKGYTFHEEQLDRHTDFTAEVTFSRRKHCAIMGNTKATQIFILSKDEIHRQKDSLCIKQFAMYGQEQELVCDRMFVPANLTGDEPQEDGDNASPNNNNPYATTFIENASEFWLQGHGFTTHEVGLENIFGNYFKRLREETYISCGIYSRSIPRVNQQK